MSWKALADQGNYAEAEPLMLAETFRGEGMFPINEVRASFYENWGDRLDGDEKIEKYKLAEDNWRMYAACSTSGGEGTARMMDVHRVVKKLEALGVEES